MFEVIQQGGPILWLILLMGVVSCVVFVERGLHLHRARIRTEDFLKGIRTNIRRNNDQEAIVICEETPGPVAHIVKTAISHRNADSESLSRIVDDAGSVEIARMERRLVGVITVAQVAPLLGLLGTIVAMVVGLGAMHEQGSLVQFSDIVNHLRQALITSAAGLMVAIPSYGFYNLLVVKIERLVLDMDRSATEILGFLARSDTGASQNDS